MGTNIKWVALELALKFEDESDIPEAFIKREATSIKEIDTKTNIGKRFLGHIQSWINTIKSILKNVEDQKQAWRFIKILPEVNSVESVTDCKDFQDFQQLLIKRRDEDNCSPAELGCLCWLHTNFQKEIKKQIDTEPS